MREFAEVVALIFAAYIFGFALTYGAPRLLAGW